VKGREIRKTSILSLLRLPFRHIGCNHKHLQDRIADATDKDFDEPLLPLGYLALFLSLLIIEFKAIPRRGQFAPGDAKFHAGISIA
jgi:hypothetical protein